MSTNHNTIAFEGHRNFRLRLILATLSGKSVKIIKIRSHDLNPGLKDYEVSFLRLLESVTNGSHIEISYTGTTVIYRPGIVIGGEVTHNCPHSKPMGYFILPMLMLAPFSKKKFSILFKGVTNANDDTGVDAIKWGLLPIMEKFGVRDCLLHILKRGSLPDGGGEVHLICNSLIPTPLTIHAIDLPKFSVIRGVAYCTRVSPSIANRMIDAARATLKPSGCEVNITADVWRGENSGKSPGFGITLVAESKKGWRIVVENVGQAKTLPEDLGELTALQLMTEITQSGTIGRYQLIMSLVFMTIGKEDIGRIKIHKSGIDENLIYALRDIKNIFGSEAFFTEDEEEPNFMILSIKGSGFTNISKKVA
ncbi:18S rRNA biogenesis protein RCL1 [Candida parapsilosis]|uniref:18S rRNA biogenesis protein RCL1 n=2 Tax=Candida parapsilosis TaxID=5480 RepID=G8BJL7_CANPC|nr:uncharacterized protein CPAR2_406360 [Candida parapsilosis]KAF6045796.1 18S rRNA biogenesis protein RCL1 [Candida parapsilosis]KAF6046651.1 18S rRNA biogenesis protein RCL1 [Candida parapsilosis]KAF6050908.1 18S rRNA biogenesis protein RCL1 [Candida parapsilosis]KAF6062370.1 18S rRNA biogenesis protein RCL1 [Candida parapsilosis]KAI5903319.1 RNA 3'-terminal phosphate cyclase-like protein [Candida parapsilosis]